VSLLFIRIRRRNHIASHSGYIPSSLMIPPRRFVTLLDQARLHQISQCIYHNAPVTPQHFSLYADHTCDTDLFPRITTTILQVHTDEVWSLEWSHSGKFLASASKDRSVIIWSVGVRIYPNTWVPLGSFLRPVPNVPAKRKS
jgi:WD40 repeat protein